MDKINWCIEQHRKTNHFYDTYLPYEFHLKMVNQVAQDFSNTLTSDIDEYVRIAIWGHDLIEDCRVSYNDCADNLGRTAANIIYAVTNEKGKTRKERANDKYYEGIRNTPGAIFVKLCDRIANVQYSKLTKSRMFEMYREENENFISSLGYNSRLLSIYSDMFHDLKKLFED